MSKSNGYSHECWSRLKDEIHSEINADNLPLVVIEINSLLDAVQERMAELAQFREAQVIYPTYLEKNGCHGHAPIELSARISRDR